MLEEQQQQQQKESIENNSSTVIIPPNTIQLVIDRTAEFIKKVGIEFEQQIEKNSNNNRFNFLISTHPYHNYYQSRLYNKKIHIDEKRTNS